MHNFKTKGPTKAHMGIEGRKVVERRSHLREKVQNQGQIHEIGLSGRRDPEGFSFLFDITEFGLLYS